MKRTWTVAQINYQWHQADRPKWTVVAKPKSLTRGMCELVTRWIRGIDLGYFWQRAIAGDGSCFGRGFEVSNF